MLELKLPASRSASRHAATTPQGRSLGPERIVLPDGRGSSLSPRYSGRAAASPLAAPGRERTAAGRPASSAMPRIRTVSPANRESGRLRGTRRAASYDDRLARNETRLVGLAVASTSLFCFLLVVYLAAYANVTSLGIQQAQVTKALRGARQQNEILRAELAAARSPQHIVASAQMQGMVPSTGRACYVTAPSVTASTQTHSRYQVASDGTDTSDTTTDLGH